MILRVGFVLWNICTRQLLMLLGYLLPGCLKEIAYTLDELNADGIALTSSYGEGSNAGSCFQSNRHQKVTVWLSAVYVGDDRYDRIWEELNQRKALVFLHGAQTPSSAPFPHAFLGIPIVEVSLSGQYTNKKNGTELCFPSRQTRRSKRQHTLLSREESASIQTLR